MLPSRLKLTRTVMSIGFACDKGGGFQQPRSLTNTSRMVSSCWASARTGASLDNQYTVVGEVVQGMDVVDKLKKAPPGSAGGSVTDPDKMVKVQVASDVK